MDELNKIDYIIENDLKNKINEHLDRQYKEGAITESEYRGFKGEGAKGQEANDLRGVGGRIPQEINRSPQQPGEPRQEQLTENKFGNGSIKDVYSTIQQHGFTKENLSKIEAYAKDIESGRSDYTRFTKEENIGLRRGGETHVEASIITGGSLKNGETYKGRKLEQWEENDRQEADIIKYAKAKKIWTANTDAHFNKLYGGLLDAGKEANVWYDEGRKKVIKAFNTFEYPDLQKALDGITLHNEKFPETELKTIGFGKNAEGDFTIIVEQPFIEHNAAGTKPTHEQLVEFARSKGFEPSADGLDHNYKNDKVNLHDLHDENVIITPDGKLAAIDTTMSISKDRAAHTEHEVVNNPDKQIADEVHPENEQRKKKYSISPKQAEVNKFVQDVNKFNKLPKGHLRERKTRRP